MHRWPSWAVAVLWLLVPLGWALLIWNYTKPVTLFIDEVRVLRTIVETGVSDFAGPLPENQVAPFGFLLVTRGLIEVFGLSLASARLPALLAGAISLPVFAWLVRRYTAPLPGLVVMAGMVGSQEWLVQACRVKPYTLDVLFAVLGLAVGLLLLERRCTWPQAIAASVLAAVGVWFSIPFYLVLLGVGMVVLATRLSPARRAELPRLAVPAMCGLLSGAAHYAWVLRPQRTASTTQQYMDHYWADAFLPWPWVSPEGWVVRAADGLADATGLALPGLVLGLVVWGLLSRVRDARNWLLFAPIVLAGCVSTARWYPVVDRLALFLAPSAFLLLALGLGALRERAGGKRGQVATVLAAAALLSATVTGRGLAPFSDDVVPVIQQVHEDLTPDQRVYLYYGARPPYDFYTKHLQPDLGFPEHRLVLGENCRDDWLHYADEIESLRQGGGEVWIIMSHVVHGRGIDEGRYFEMLLDRHGERLLEHRGWRSRAILWRADPSPPAHPPSADRHEPDSLPTEHR